MQYLGLSPLFVILFEQMRAWGRTEHVIQNKTEMTGTDYSALTYTLRLNWC